MHEGTFLHEDTFAGVENYYILFILIYSFFLLLTITVFPNPYTWSVYFKILLLLF